MLARIKATSLPARRRRLVAGREPRLGQRQRWPRPRAIVRAWMQLGRATARNILDRRFRDDRHRRRRRRAGRAEPGELGGTYVTDFGAGCRADPARRAARVAAAHGRRPAPPRPALRPRPSSARSHAVVAPPYDVIDAEQRARAGRALAATTSSRSTCPRPARRRPLRARRRAASSAGSAEGALVRDDEPALWALDAGLHRPRRARAARATASSRACASRTTAPAASARTSARIPGPKEDRLRLTRATRANLSPIFSPLRRPRPAPPGRRSRRTPTASRGARRPTTTARVNRLWRVDRPEAIARRAATALARRRAADRRRPPPLRDRARLRRGDRRRGRAPLRAHVPRRAAGPGPDRLPHPPPAAAASTTDAAGGARATRCARLRDRAEIDADELAPAPTATAPLQHRLHRRPLPARRSA